MAQHGVEGATGMELIVEQYGTFVRKHQGRLRVHKDKAVLEEVPLLHLEQV